MPFTAAHPAIVLPFVHLSPRFVSATGLIAGSVAPDFEYFFKLSVDGVYGHTLWGLLYFDVPVATLLSFLFHGVVKKNLIINLPRPIQSRMQFMLAFDFTSHFRRHVLIFLLCCLAGAASHVLWDSFTHNSGYFASRLSVYRHSFELMGTRYPLFFILQHVSTVIGIAAIILFIMLMKPGHGRYERPSARYWIVVMLAVPVVATARFSFRPSDLDLGNFVVTLVSGACIGLIAGGLLRDRAHAN